MEKLSYAGGVPRQEKEDDRWFRLGRNIIWLWRFILNGQTKVAAHETVHNRLGNGAALSSTVALAQSSGGGAGAVQAALAPARPAPQAQAVPRGPHFQMGAP
jgi:hypothetical protein